MAQEGYLAHWARTAASHAGDPHYAFAARIGDVDKVVISRTRALSEWERTVLAAGDLSETVNALKRRPGKDLIAFGGVGPASSLVAAGLVDEYQFYVNPTALGAGRTIFGAAVTLPLRLLASTAYPCGVVVSRYTPAG